MQVNVQRTNLESNTLDAISSVAEMLAKYTPGNNAAALEETLIGLVELGWIDGKQSTHDRVDYRVGQKLEGNSTEYPDEQLINSMDMVGSGVL